MRAAGLRQHGLTTMEDTLDYLLYTMDSILHVRGAQVSSAELEKKNDEFHFMEDNINFISFLGFGAYCYM